MAITCKDNVFTLKTKNSAYQMKADRGFLFHTYYGPSVGDTDMSYLGRTIDRGFSGNPEGIDDRGFSLDTQLLEYPGYGTGDYRDYCLRVVYPDGSQVTNLKYIDYEILEGKYALEGLPAMYQGEEKAETLKITLRDIHRHVEVILYYGVFENLDIITRACKVINKGSESVHLRRAYSMCLDFHQKDMDFIQFYGRHAMERVMERSHLHHGVQGVGSRRGYSSHQYNPAMILAGKDTTEEAGDCYAMVFVYSGCFKAEAEKDQFNQTRALMGLASEIFSYPLGTGDSFVIPETVMTYSAEGLSVLSHNLHRCFRNNLCRGRWKDQVRPVLVNSWEADYFNFTGESLLRLGKHAAELGIEMLVLDDGWFGERNDDNTSLGDWVVNEKKLGCTMGELIDRIHDLGLKFGLWIEPEMVSEDSDLYRTHPDWALQIPKRNPVRGRNQLVLDFSRKEIRDHVFDQICAVLDQGNVEYIKWDMNRSLSDIYSSETKEQGKVLYDYMLGVYDFLERLTERYPDTLIEGCSGGGGRFDAGMLYYTPQIWCSDNTDPIDRLEIQYGTSFIYPVSSVGSHVSASPNHQTGRVTSLKTRAVAATPGTFGYELDLNKLSEEEKDEIRGQIKEYKKYARLVQQGLYYRLTDPQTADTGAWEFVSEDGKEALVQAVTIRQHANMDVSYIKLRGLAENTVYREEESGRTYNSTALMEAGIPVPVELGEYRAYQWHFVQEEQGE